MVKKSLKERLPLACIIGAAFGLTFFFFSVLQSYAGNYGKFLFTLKDFIAPVAVIAVFASVFAAALILFTGPKLGKWIAGARAYFLQNFVDSEYVPDHRLHGYSREELQEFADLLSRYIEHVGIRGID